jgi:creatinine amidohydrolase/Fe(II)-dependent formamide hydrolase-like protein
MVRLAEHTTTTAADALADAEVGLLPTGSTEQHGPALPLSTDFTTAEAFARSQAREDAVEQPSTSPPSQAREDAVEQPSTSPPSQAREDALEEAEAGASDTWGRQVHGADVGFDTADFSESGAVGTPTDASAGAGERIVEAASESLDALVDWLAERSFEELQPEPHR